MRRSALNLMLSALLAGCGGSGESLNSIPEEPPEPDAPQLLGRVTDLQGNPLDGVRVDFDGRSTESLANGRFMFSDAAGDPRPLVATAPGWSRAWRTVAAISDASQELELRLAPARSVQLPDAALGGVIDGDDGVQIELPAAPLVRSDGTAASGPFTVQWALMNSRPGLRASPGGLWAQDALGERALLESFGMVDVQLWQGDEPLQLRGDEPARLRFPLAATAEYEDGASAPLWHFDEELGLWSQQGWGEVHGGVFEAQVPHFSTWNCDDTFETTCITGRLVDDAGQGVPEVIIRSVGVDYLGTDLVWSFGSGEFVVYARAASEVEVSAVQIVDGSYRDILRTTVSTPGSAGAPCLELPTTVITPPDVDNDGDGFDEDEGDCDDVDPARYPGAMVLCSRIDMDCDGVEDSGVDADGDGWGSCLDCDDSDPRRHPQALEICDGVDDNDCEGDPDPRELDADGDGSSWCGGDCDDTDPIAVDQCSVGAVAGGDGFVCALRTDGSVSCAGDGAPTLPAGGRYLSLAAGGRHVCAVDLQGDIACWTAEGLALLPPTEAFVGLSVGAIAACGVTTAGAVRCWGLIDPPPLLADAAAVDVRGGAACALRTDERITCWGTVESITGTFRAAAVSDAGVCALYSSTGDPVCWPDSDLAQGLPAGPWRQLDRSDDVLCAVSEDGALACEGPPSDPLLTVPQGYYSSVDVGNDYACALDDAQVLRCWGPGAPVDEVTP